VVGGQVGWGYDRFSIGAFGVESLWCLGQAFARKVDLSLHSD
jgi:hypothetical protein